MSRIYDPLPDNKKLKEDKERPYNFDKMLLRYNELKEDPTIEPDFKDKAIIMIVEFQLALEKGNKHYHPKTKKELKNLEEIFETLSDHRTIDIIIEKNKE